MSNATHTHASLATVVGKVYNWLLLLSSVKLHVSIGKYWVLLYVLVCMVVRIVEHIGMY